MHCPRCGQQQVSEETKFCSRCGFPLGLVSDLVTHGGFLPQLADLPKNKKWFTRKNTLKFTLLWFLFFLLIMAPIAGIANVDELAGFFAIVGIFGGLIMMIFSFLFLPKEQKNYYHDGAFQGANQPAQFTGAPQNQHALPPQSYQPVESYIPAPGSWKAPHTGELVQPGSVTDATTKLLKRDE